MNIHKRQTKKPAFLSVFERSDEKEDNPLLHDSSASLFNTAASVAEIDLPPLQASPSEQGNKNKNHDHHGKDTKSSGERNDDPSPPSSKWRSDSDTGSGGHGNASKDTDANLTHSDAVDGVAAEPNKMLRDSATQSSRGLMESQIYSEHSESLTLNYEMDDDAIVSSSAGRGDEMVVDNTVQVPDNLVKHATASALATSKSRERRSSRLLSGAKGLLRGVKAVTSPQKKPKVELEAAVRKISAGESAKPFAQLSLEEISPDGAGTGLVTTRDEVDNHDSDDDSEDKSNQSLGRHEGDHHQRVATLEYPTSPVSKEETRPIDVRKQEDISKKGSPRRSGERRTRALSATDEHDKDGEQKSRRRHRQTSTKEPVSSERRDRQRSVRSSESTYPKESGESHRRRSSNRPRGDAPTEKPDVKDSVNHKTSRQDRRRSELKTLREESTLIDVKALPRVASDDSTAAVIGHAHDSMFDGKHGTTAERESLHKTSKSSNNPAVVITSPHDSALAEGGHKVKPGERSDDPQTPQQGQGGRLSDLLRKDRASKTTDVPTKRRAIFAKAQSDRILSVSNPSEMISPTGAESESHKRITTTDDIHVKSIGLLSLSMAELSNAVDKVASTSNIADREKSKEHADRQERRKARPEHAQTVKSPKRKPSSDSKNFHGQSRPSGDNNDGQPHDKSIESDEIAMKQMALELLGLGPSDPVSSREKSNGHSTEEHEIRLAKEPLSDLQSRSNEGGADQASSRQTGVGIDQPKEIELNMDIASKRENKVLSTVTRGRTASRTAARSPKRVESSPVGHSSSMEDLVGVPISQQSPRKSSNGRRSSHSIVSAATDLSDDGASLSKGPAVRRMSYVSRRSRSPSPRHSQGVVFTWQRNLPARATIAATRRNARLAARRPSASWTSDETTQNISNALVKAYSTAGSDVPVEQSREAEIKVQQPDLLSEELRDEYTRLSVELQESADRVRGGKAIVKQLECDIATLQGRLDKVEQRKRT